MSSGKKESGKGQAHMSNPYSEMKVPIFLLVTFFVLGCAMLAVAVWLLPKEDVFKIFLEHLGSAFIVASAIGLTYEVVVHKKREMVLRLYAEEHGKAFDRFVAMSPYEIFKLLEDIAKQVGKIPTLYSPPRVDEDEYTFASSIHYFRTLVRVKRGEVIEVLREWIREESDPKLKFLASDFIGEFHLDELRDELKRQAVFTDWDEITKETKEWRLNYAWASSRISPRQYVALARLARETPYPDVEKWIMFIPRQMKDRGFLLVINEYLKRSDLDDDKLITVVKALGELYREDKAGVKRILKRYGTTLNRKPVLAAIDKMLRAHTDASTDVIRSIEGGLMGRRRTPTAAADYKSQPAPPQDAEPHP